MMRIKIWFKKRSALELLSITVLIISLFMIIIYFINFHNGFSDDSEKWGSFGDYFGSITGLLAFLGVLYSLILSEKRADEADMNTYIAKKEAKKEAEFAKFEADKREEKIREETVRREERDLFFKLLELHQEKLNSVVYNVKDIDVNFVGLAAFEQYVNILNNILFDYALNYCITNITDEDFKKINLKVSKSFDIDVQIINKVDLIKGYINSNPAEVVTFEQVQELINKYINNTAFYKKNIGNTNKKSLVYSGIFERFNIEIYIDEMFNALKLAGDAINEEYGHIVGQYFRNMYYILETCNKFQFDKEYYCKLFRAQLSRNEIIIILCNSVSFKSSGKFVKLLDQYDILDDLYFKDLFLIQFRNTWQSKENVFIKGIFRTFLEE